MKTSEEERKDLVRGYRALAATVVRITVEDLEALYQRAKRADKQSLRFYITSRDMEVLEMFEPGAHWNKMQSIYLGLCGIGGVPHDIERKWRYIIEVYKKQRGISTGKKEARA